MSGVAICVTACNIDLHYEQRCGSKERDVLAVLMELSDATDIAMSNGPFESLICVHTASMLYNSSDEKSSIDSLEASKP